ncbi:restriction endonuclease subunit S [Phaeodactylibacter xiamenensis]|uniref:restriction endonuclease subunit S n=1 Tax=Phaeodactylibacter xiamenensis TaxID=1524460 RepID=UPI0024A98837|nr:restriction endonuclease subunit S [Phaeodactylibacter xiamenensis]
MNNWKEATFDSLLSNIVDNRGKTCPTAEVGIPLIATNCIRNNNLYPVFEKVRFIDDETYKSWFRGHPEPGDMVFVTKGTPGRVCWVPDPVSFCIAQDMVAIRADESKVYPKYLFAALRSPQIQGQIEGLHVGSLIPHFKKGNFNELIIPIPPTPIQRYIGDMYLDFSLKIDLLHRQNQTLEQIAEALFRQWFVEEADESWEIGTLDDVLTVKGGTTPSTKNPDDWDGDIHWTSPRDITTLNSIYLFDTERKITEAGLRKISSGLLPKGTLLMSSRAPVGVLAFAEVPIAINQGYIAILDEKGFSKEFLFLWLKTNMGYVQSYANGSTFLEISKSAFKSLEIQIPPEELRKEFQEWVIPYFKKIKSNQTQIRTLTALRDTLLPKLMSGEVRVDI